MILRQEVTLLMDLKLSLEYQDVALRQEHIDESGSTRQEVFDLIRNLEAFAEEVTITTKVRPSSTDPNDDMVLDLAINGQADAIVTLNVRHFRKVAATFRLDVISPGELMQRLSKEGPWQSMRRET